MAAMPPETSPQETACDWPGASAMVMSGGVAPVIQEPAAPQTTAMMELLAPLTRVLTLGPSLPSQHWPLLAAALRPSALKPRESRELVLTLAAALEFVVGALA